MKILKYTSLILTLFAFFSCGNVDKSEKTESIETQLNDNEIVLSRNQFEKNNMEMDGLISKPFSVIVKSNGVIDVPPENKAIVNAHMGGYIKSTPLLVGDIVKKGQILVTIENPEFVTLQQDYMEIKEQLAFLESEFSRQKTLFDEKITSQKKYLKAESDFKSSMAKYKGLKKQLEMLNISIKNTEYGEYTSISTIYSPISGSITKVNVSIGTYVSPASQIMEIINNDHIHVELLVFEKDILKLKEGQKINFKVPEASNEVFKANVHLIGTSIDKMRTVKVHGHLDEEGHHNFLVGMYVEANIIAKQEILKGLPTDAIVEIEGKYYVLLLDSNINERMSFNQVLVETGKTFGGYTEIKNSSDFSTNDKFLIKGAFSLING